MTELEVESYVLVVLVHSAAPINNNNNNNNNNNQDNVYGAVIMAEALREFTWVI